MSERTCSGGRWFVRSDQAEDKFGECRRFPPLHSQNTAWLAVQPAEFCGEWADGRLTAEQAERQQRVKEFALAIVQGLFANPEGDMVDVMTESQRIANEWQSQMEGQQ